MAARDQDRRARFSIKNAVNRFYKSLTYRMVAPVVLAICLVGAGLYYFVLRSVSAFTEQQIQDTLTRIASEVYDICDHNFTALMQSGRMNDDKSLRISKALTLGAIEDYAKRNLLNCMVYENGRGRMILQQLQPGLKTQIHLHPAENPSFFGNKNDEYYFYHIDFKPWNWHIELVKDSADYKPLMDRVKTAYFVTGILLLVALTIILFVLERLLHRPLNQIITAIRSNRPPGYRGVYELEFLSDNIARMMKSLEERNEWIKRLYQTAVAQKGAPFYDRIAATISDALGLDTLILRTDGSGKTLQTVAAHPDDHFPPDRGDPASMLPCAEIAVEKRPVLIPKAASQRLSVDQNPPYNAMETYLGVPFFDSLGEVTGIINVFGPERALGEWEINLIKTAGQMLGADFELVEKAREQERFQEQIFHVQKLESLAILAGGIAHDFNNLLMGIQGNTSLILMDLTENTHHREMLESIEENVQRGVELTRQLLGMARGGKYAIKPLDMNALIQQNAAVFGRTKKEVTIHENYQNEVWTTEADKGQIEQVLLNMFINAWQAMPSGGELFLETQNVVIDEPFARRFSAVPGKYVKISIRDTGTGMDRKTQQKVFDPFFTTKGLGRGTGLGLASAYGIIKNHSGFITLQSEPGKGSVFEVYLPASDKTALTEQHKDDEILTGTERILLVDDEEMVAEVGREMLQRLGYTPRVANSGKEAIEIFESLAEAIDLVILDMIMPEMSGRELFVRLKDIRPGIKVLLSSGYSVNGQAEDIIRQGCDGFIQKPFRLVELSQKVRSVLDG